MEIKIALVNIKEKEILKKLIEEYEKELLNIENPGEYKYLNSYWEKENRFPYFIKINNEIIGFVLVNGHTLVNKDGKNIAEFYIKKEFRKNGFGKMIAIKVFDLFKGNWEIREIEENLNARTFWIKVIDNYTDHRFKETKMKNQDWFGWIQTFNNS